MTGIRDPLITRVALPSDRDASGRDLGDRELELLAEVVRSGHLNSTGGTMVPRLEREFAAVHGVPRAVACASGTAAIHAALGAVGLGEGDEVVTTAITDMGAVLPIAYEGARPVFADVDPLTLNVTAGTIAARLGPRTRAVIVTHLFGQACDIDPIIALCRPRGIVVIEDAAQAFLATDRGRLCGTIGDLGCFSFQQGKHMTTGEGGMVVSRDPRRADLVRRFVNKGWGYGDPNPDHDRPGMNYRLTELQAAVGIAQLEKLGGCVARRRITAARLCDAVRGLPGIGLPEPREHSAHSYWRFAIRVDSAQIEGGAEAFGRELADCGVQNAPRYVKKPAFDCAVLRSERWFGGRAQVGATPHDHSSHPGTYAGLEQVVVLPWNEHYDEGHVSFIAESMRRAHKGLWRREASGGR